LQGLLRVANAIDRLQEGVGKVVVWLVPFVVLLGVWNVFGRYVGFLVGRNLASNVLIEGQWYTFSLIFFLGAAWTLLHDGHVRVDVFYGGMSPRNKAIVNIIGTALFLLPFMAMLIYFCWPYVRGSWRILEDSPEPSGLPRYPLQTVMIVGPLLLLLQGISEIIKNVAFLRGALSRRPGQRKDSETAL
jgi:TRAP-type mannitol/chloroaromatic compound transport system permease small subunit